MGHHEQDEWWEDGLLKDPIKTNKKFTCNLSQTLPDFYEDKQKKERNRTKEKNFFYTKTM